MPYHKAEQVRESIRAGAVAALAAVFEYHIDLFDGGDGKSGAQVQPVAEIIGLRGRQEIICLRKDRQGKLFVRPERQVVRQPRRPTQAQAECMVGIEGSFGEYLFHSDVETEVKSGQRRRTGGQILVDGPFVFIDGKIVPRDEIGQRSGHRQVFIDPIGGGRTEISDMGAAEIHTPVAYFRGQAPTAHLEIRVVFYPKGFFGLGERGDARKSEQSGHNKSFDSHNNNWIGLVT